jgi:hypothetical protein
MDPSVSGNDKASPPLVSSDSELIDVEGGVSVERSTY